MYVCLRYTYIYTYTHMPVLWVGTSAIRWLVPCSFIQRSIVLDRKQQAEGERQEGDSRLPAEVFIKAIQLFDLLPKSQLYKKKSPL